MLILHTSDLHLNSENPHTFDALECILNACKSNSVDLMTIAGDLFHKPQDVETLRTRLRQILSGLDFDILSISGNHDAIAYSRNLDFGENIRMITKSPFDILSYDGANIVAVPFTEALNDDDYIKLKAAIQDDQYNILLIHCTLDIGYGSSDFGDEEVIKYCNIQSSVLSSLGYDLVLGGHFHKDFYIKEIGEGSRFVYPGSPVSLSWKEIGQRRVALIDTEKATITPIPLESHFYDKRKVMVFPGTEENSLIEIEDWVAEYSGKKCELSVEVEGFGDMDEVEFGESLRSACPGVILANNYRNVENVLSHNLFQRFNEKLGGLDESINKESIKNIVIEVFSEMLSRGPL